MLNAKGFLRRRSGYGGLTKVMKKMPGGQIDADSIRLHGPSQNRRSNWVKVGLPSVVASTFAATATADKAAKAGQTDVRVRRSLTLPANRMQILYHE
jgi:hypothetical protein